MHSIINWKPQVPVLWLAPHEQVHLPVPVANPKP